MGFRVWGLGFRVGFFGGLVWAVGVGEFKAFLGFHLLVSSMVWAFSRMKALNFVCVLDVFVAILKEKE